MDYTSLILSWKSVDAVYDTTPIFPLIEAKTLTIQIHAQKLTM